MSFDAETFDVALGVGVGWSGIGPTLSDFSGIGQAARISTALELRESFETEWLSWTRMSDDDEGEYFDTKGTLADGDYWNCDIEPTDPNITWTPSALQDFATGWPFSPGLVDVNSYRGSNYPGGNKTISFGTTDLLCKGQTVIVGVLLTDSDGEDENLVPSNITNSGNSFTLLADVAAGGLRLQLWYIELNYDTPSHEVIAQCSYAYRSMIIGAAAIEGITASPFDQAITNSGNGGVADFGSLTSAAGRHLWVGFLGTPYDSDSHPSASNMSRKWEETGGSAEAHLSLHWAVHDAGDEGPHAESILWTPSTANKNWVSVMATFKVFE